MKISFSSILTVAIMAALMTAAAEAADDGSVDPFKYWSSQWESSKAVDREVPAKKAKVDDAPKAVAPTKPVEQPSGDKPVAAKPVTKPVERVAPVPVRMVRETRIINRGMDKASKSRLDRLWEWALKSGMSDDKTAPAPKAAKADKAPVEKDAPVPVNQEMINQFFFDSAAAFEAAKKDGDKPREGVKKIGEKLVVVDVQKFLASWREASKSEAVDQRIVGFANFAFPKVSADGKTTVPYANLIEAEQGLANNLKVTNDRITRLEQTSVGLGTGVFLCLITMVATTGLVVLLKKKTIWLD